MPLTTAQATRLLAGAHWATLLQTLRTHLREKRLLFGTIGVFLTVYVVVAYVLVARGLEFVNQMPLLGPLLTERLIYVLFFFFFFMLVVSNATITGMGLFKRKETSWLLSLPLPHKSLVLWKTLEGMVIASWGLMLMSTPILMAIGKVYHATLAFYAATLPAMACLVVLASNVSAWILLTMIRWIKREWLAPLLWVAGAGLLGSVLRVWPVAAQASKPGDIATNVGQILGHTDAFTHPMLPSSWVAEVVLAAGRGTAGQAWFYNLTLLSYALLSVVVTLFLAGKIFYPAWTRSLQPAKTRFKRDPGEQAAGPAWMRWLPVDRVGRALILKDVRTFLREPAQWGQTALVFGLLFLYTSNLRRIVFEYQDVFWNVVTSYLNLLVCSLSLSTLTTRFIFPQVSAEGQRLWLLGLSPVPMRRLLSTKLRLTVTVTGLLTVALTLISCITLSMNLERSLYFISCIFLLTLGLNALALGLGALFPDFRETNPAKIVSGFGGTLCLILSFVYIVACVSVSLLPGLRELRLAGAGIEEHHRWRMELLSLGGILGITAFFGGLPYAVAQKQIMDLNYFKKCDI